MCGEELLKLSSSDQEVRCELEIIFNLYRDGSEIKKIKLQCQEQVCQNTHQNEGQVFEEGSHGRDVH